MFYDRDRDQGDIPTMWVRKMKEAIRSLTPAFSARRMVKEYAELAYAPAAGVAPRRANNHR
jgi:starch phosphorylase